jgi:hypothetical protein
VGLMGHHFCCVPSSRRNLMAVVQVLTQLTRIKITKPEMTWVGLA